MTTMILSEPPVPVMLTAQEYAQLPPSSRMELVDGALMVGEPPALLHQDVVDRMRQALDGVCPERFRVVREQEVRLGELLRRNPDLMVVEASACDPYGCSFAPVDVLLAVEVESPSSRTRDRLHKFGEYAEASIAHYWRVETTPGVVVHTYRLGETGSYLETGLFASGDTTAAPGLPWATIAVAALEPRRPVPGAGVRNG